MLYVTNVTFDYNSPRFVLAEIHKWDSLYQEEKVFRKVGWLTYEGAIAYAHFPFDPNKDPIRPRMAMVFKTYEFDSVVPVGGIGNEDLIIYSVPPKTYSDFTVLREAEPGEVLQMLREATLSRTELPSEKE